MTWKAQCDEFIQVRERKIMKKSLCSGLAILLLTFATITGARPIKLPPPNYGPSSVLPVSFWLSLFTGAVK
jgi:hypothetical protein